MSSYLSEIDQTALLTADQEKQLAHEIAEGNVEARDQLVRANLRLVVNIARAYCGKGMDLQDVIEEGNLGLLRAVEGFDPNMNTRFSTYASFWIKQSIKRGLVNHGKTIRVPAYMAALIAKWRRTMGRLSDELGRTPTSEEVARVLGVSKKKIAIVEKAIRVYNTAPSGIESAWSINDMPTVSMSSTPADPEEVRQVMRLLDEMDQREASVLRMRFGLGDEQPMTLKEVGFRLGLTRERARQIEAQALAKLAAQLEA